MPKVIKAEIVKRPFARIESDIKKSAWSAAIESLVIMLFGIMLVAWPDVTVLVVSNLIGAIFVIGGIYRIINYFVVKGQQDFFNNSLLSGVVYVLAGIATIVIGEDIAHIFRIIIDIMVPVGVADSVQCSYVRTVPILAHLKDVAVHII